MWYDVLVMQIWRNTTGRINRGALQSRLITFFTHNCTAPLDLLKYIKVHKSIIFHKDDIPNKFMGPVHALCLQLVLYCIVDLAVHGDKASLIGKFDLKKL